MSAADAEHDGHYARGKRLRALAEVGRARIGNGMQRLLACAVVAVVTSSVVGNFWPLVWYLGFVAVILCDRAIFARLLARCEAGEAPQHMRWLIGWTFLQSFYGNALAILLWFAPYVPGDTLAVIYLCGGVANAATTLRSSHALSIAGLTPTISMFLGLPATEYFITGANNPLLLLPVVGGLLLVAFGVNLWRSLLESDAAQARAEAAVLRERQAAAAAAAAKSDVIKRMNDELRTPMQALAGAAEHLRRAAATPQARAHIAAIAQAGEVLKLVLDDLSDLDRLENGALRIASGPADPRDIVRGVASAFRAAAQDKHLELFLDIGETPALVELDARRVRQILFNLVANAVRYTAHGGVRISLAAQAAAAPGRVQLRFTVSDTGAGLSRAQLARIFSRDQRAGGGAGAGLGLPISLRLARLMGASLSAKSDPGQGSVFTLSLEAPRMAPEGNDRRADAA